MKGPHVHKIGRYVIFALVMFVSCGMVGWFWGKAVGRKEMMTEAVKQNHGHYRITDEIGSTVFEWGPGPALAPQK